MSLPNVTQWSEIRDDFGYTNNFTNSLYSPSIIDENNGTTEINDGFDNTTDLEYTVATIDTNWSKTSDIEFVMASTSASTSQEELTLEREVLQFWIGVGLSIASSVFIGISFIIKKKALIRLSKGGRRANQGGYGYLKDLLWWSGLLAMAVGEAANFMAYTFAPASLVSTLGVLSVLVTAIFSSKYLRERLNFLGKIGCFLCTIGSTVIVIHAPMEKDIASMDDLEAKLTNIVFVIYVLFAIIISIILIYHFRPKLPETSTYTLLIWIGVCSLVGSLSVMSVKGLGLALMQTVTGVGNELGNWLTWFCFFTLVVCVSVQMNFLNKALDTFNTAVVTPIYYVFFTSCVIMASAILFNEFAYLPVKDWIGLLCGFFTVLTAIFLLHLCKNFDFTFENLTQRIDFVNDYSNVESTAISTLSKVTNPYAVPIQVDLKDNLKNTKCDIDSDTDLDELYRSIDSCDSSRCKKKNGKSRLPPDIKLLSHSFSSLEKGRKSRDGYKPVSYGTTNIISPHYPSSD